ncbi:YggS family pyridoxal phosphate-dependent enzyme [Paenalkalicoccus suaedae]|uniref:Pyridoxal phosphate homeostasis protein n=1 Tax=Paenalkalicoccus suaedae TaxID=2592382 RepID=A0A859FEY0_9BACI|nr:YggS family pyridoxal phosphate-dependent enzyme [Paenalkalicoccus suaedae]QKS71511.1 YggS family pyridoxal phosphate-dependent enzyme [Paenalkalicoccus suaedae]
MSVVNNLEEIRTRIAQACHKVDRNPNDVTIVAVTKYVSIETAKEALKAGITDLGENRLEEGMNKFDDIKHDATWHFIGTLQSRKVKEMIHAFDFVHSIERESIAKEIEKRVEDGRTISAFVQVNVTGEESKSGLTPDEVLPFIEKLAEYKAVRIVGLMTMAPHVEDPETVRPAFRALRELQQEIASKNFAHAPCTELSMGMSNDYEVAIEEGATYIRLGSCLVGNEKKG